ncbi:hypothetical protein DFJ58DRAFT_847925 [Suillus subalutaceus]|uniref:uncharacterized protein n=1 Tax=Suillus subalutaceus TaxID=48586 RepID=UPI001B88409E|nr:uncharacterized protein DFJ58DRAFT_847925 [Suillus subalutaceus]KAG1832900.1 hypothetical protein DFJ58DRAFT_847925 [Suillus subalutaceus]
MYWDNPAIRHCEPRESYNFKPKQAALAAEASLEAGSSLDMMDQSYNGCNIQMAAMVTWTWTRTAPAMRTVTQLNPSYSLPRKQLPALTNTYLTWKHNNSLNIAQISAHKFQVTVMHVFELDYFHDIMPQDEEVVNVSLLHAFTKVLCTIHNVDYAQRFRYQFSITFNVYLQHGCPPCMFEQPNECPLYPASLKAMDGNNSAKRMANAGSADPRIFPSRYMIPLDQVDMFKDDVQLHPGECGADQLMLCTDNWKATNSTEENTVHVFEQTGIFLSACRHGIVQTVTKMCRSGKLAKYPLTTINKLLDIFDLHFDQWDMDKYLELSRFIFNNYKQVVTLINDFTQELNAMDLKTWVTEELAYMESIASEPARDTLTVNYVEALEKLNTYQMDQFLTYLPSSFTPDSGLSVAASQSTKQAQAINFDDKYLEPSSNDWVQFIQHWTSTTSLLSHKICEGQHYNIPWSNTTHCGMAVKYFKIL